MAALKEYHFEIGPMDDSSQCVAIVGAEYSSVSEDEAFYAKEDVDAALAEKDTEIQALKQKLMTYGDANASLAKENTDLKLIAESRGTEVAQLKCDIADLRDDKKTTDAILDERNAEIAEISGRLQTANLVKDEARATMLRFGRLAFRALANWARAERRPLEQWGCWREAERWADVEHKALENLFKYGGPRGTHKKK